MFRDDSLSGKLYWVGAMGAMAPIAPPPGAAPACNKRYAVSSVNSAGSDHTPCAVIKAMCIGASV